MSLEGLGNNGTRWEVRILAKPAGIVWRDFADEEAVFRGADCGGAEAG